MGTFGVDNLFVCFGCGLFCFCWMVLLLVNVRLFLQPLDDVKLEIKKCAAYQSDSGGNRYFG